MKKRFLTALVVTCAMSASLFATVRPGPCEFSVTGEWVYLHPLIDDTYYVMTDVRAELQSVNGKRHANDQGYHSGFRIGLGYGFDNCLADLRASWVSLRGADSESIYNTNYIPTKGLAGTINPGDPADGTASSKISSNFDRVDLLMGYRLTNWECFNLVFEGGVQYSRITNESGYVYTPADNDNGSIITEKSEAWGVGPQVGFDACYDLFDCFSLVATANTALLIGEVDSKFNALYPVAPTEPSFVKNLDDQRIIPSFQARLGVSYSFSCCWDFVLEAGYEALSYLNALDEIEFQIDQDLTSAYTTTRSSNVHYHGPYVSLTATF